MGALTMQGFRLLAGLALLAFATACGGGGGDAPKAAGPCVAGGMPSVALNAPPAGATQLSGHACNIDVARTKLVIYVLTNQWYVQPFAATPFTTIAADGTWTSFTHPWNRIAVLLVDPATYVPPATMITHPALSAGVIAATEYPSTAPASFDFSGRRWGIKVAAAPFDPGPNYWSNDPGVVSVAADGLHLKIRQIGGLWQCAEVYLLESLGYGTYTVQVASDLSGLDRNTVAAPLFLYADSGQEIDNEYSGAGGLVGGGFNAQFVAQPFTTPGNLVRYNQPATGAFTTQMQWRADRVVFRTWNGWSASPAANEIIHEWTYTGANIPAPGQERVRLNLWLLNGLAPAGGVGDEMVIRSFVYAP